MNEEKRVTIRENLARFLKSHRLKEGITQRELAVKLGCSESLIKKIECEAVFNLEQTFNQLHNFASLDKLSLGEFLHILEGTPARNRGFKAWELDVISKFRQISPIRRKIFVDEVILGKSVVELNRFLRLISALSDKDAKHYDHIEQLIAGVE